MILNLLVHYADRLINVGVGSSYCVHMCYCDMHQFTEESAVVQCTGSWLVEM